MAQIRLENIKKSFGAIEVIRDVSLQIEEREFVVFVGPSGCGKSTLLRLIAGLEAANSGRIWIDDRDVTDLEPYDRHLSMVFQSYALYPHMSVRDNISFALRTAAMPKEEIGRKVADAARILKLEDYLDRRPAALSGGQRQRVAIGRAIVREPLGFLFDEPLSNLDAALRSETRLEIAHLHKSLGATMVYVTHDQVEAMTLADKIVVLQRGQIMQVGSPRELFERPQNLFVAQFIGSPKMNLIPCRTRDGEVYLTETTKIQPAHSLLRPAVQMGIRPEHLLLTSPSEGILTGRIEANEYLGTDNSVFVDAGVAGRVNLRVPGDARIHEGDVVGIDFSTTNSHFFDDAGLRV